MSDTIRVYINSKPVDAPAGASALEAVTVWDPAVAAEIRAGARALTDSRGLPVAADVPLFHGAIFRVVRGRERDSSSEAG